MLNSFFSKKINLSQTLTCLIFAAIVTIFCNFALVMQKFSVAFEAGFAMWILEISLNYFLVFVFLYCCSFNKIILAIVLSILLFLSLIAAYSFNEFNVLIDQVVIANTLDNIDGFGDAVTLKTAIIYFILFIALPLALLLKIKIIKDNNRKIFLTIVAIFLVFVAILSSLGHQNRKLVIYSYPPVGLLESYVAYYNQIYFSLKNKPASLPINDLIKTEISSNKIKNLKVVLIIGESARSKNLSIGGYERETTPRIKKIHNLLGFGDVTPCGNLTAYSVECMLSRRVAKDFAFPTNEESIIKVFEKLKFSTSYFSTQKAVGDNNSLILLASEAQKFHFNDIIFKRLGGAEVYDEYLLSDLRQELARDDDSFIILQTLGSHFLFNERYTDKFKIFTPTCEVNDLTKCTRQEVINAYDNSILYTDFFISSVVKELKKQNALLIYISDHGQFLGEDGIYYHGPLRSFDSENHRVPMFLWMSDKLMERDFYRQKFDKAAKKITHKLSHDNLFYSILDCAGIEVENDDLSVCK